MTGDIVLGSEQIKQYNIGAVEASFQFRSSYGIHGRLLSSSVDFGNSK
jgi:hypothetical protein